MGERAVAIYGEQNNEDGFSVTACVSCSNSDGSIFIDNVQFIQRPNCEYAATQITPIHVTAVQYSSETPTMSYDLPDYYTNTKPDVCPLLTCGMML